MRKIITAFLSILIVIGIVLGNGVALAHGEDEDKEPEPDGAGTAVTFSASPRFPVAGQPAELTFTVLHQGVPEEELPLTVVLTPLGTGHGHDGAHHQHSGEVADEHPHDEAAEPHHDEGSDEELESVTIAPAEIAPGVYTAEYTFDSGGKYLVTAQIGDEQREFEVAVRSAPVAWSFIIGLGAVSVFLAGMVAVVKTVRKEW
ncbi:MAG TPA: hypothetical protein G4O01_08320 [Dehalococcoidia bacterium]|nr:hypothetical protein [Dehalococcoidia bacterium]